MKQLIRRLSRVADASQQQEESLLAPKARRRGLETSDDEREGGGTRAWQAEVPEGHLPVYVGEEMERFVVRADLLSRPVFLELLRRSAEEYGYEQQGVLRIPCPAPVFQRVLDVLVAGEGAGERRRGDELERWFREETAVRSS